MYSDVDLDKIDADIVKAGTPEIVDEIDVRDIIITANNQIDFFAVPDGWPVLKDVIQSNLSIIGSYTGLPLVIDGVNYICYASNWKQTIVNSKKTFIFKEV